eukprot:SAG22_NODE_197_length_15520_cov_116.311264_5_plen_161_part_00
MCGTARTTELSASDRRATLQLTRSVLCRGYIRHEIKPVLDRIKDILHAHHAAIEAPPHSWLIETFPGHGKFDTPTVIVDNVVTYARAWDRVLAEWDAGRLDVLYPPHHMMPWGALGKFILWSRERGEAKQHELIGMSGGRKDVAAKNLLEAAEEQVAQAR